jgi:hypothetical protein
MKATTARSSLAALALLVACSSKPKQTDETAARSGSAPAATAPAPQPAPGSAADPWAEKPPEVAAAELRADIDIMCGAAKVTGGKTVNDVGPYIAETMKTGFKVELFANIRNITLDEFIARMRKGMDKAGVKQCDTLDVLIANDPRKPR